MKTNMITIRINENTYTRAFSNVTWTGAIKGTARSLQVEYYLSDNIAVEVGDQIEFSYDGSATLFYGRVFKVEKNAQNNSGRFSAYDCSIYLNKNYFVKNYYEKTPSEIVKEIAGELQLSVGRLPTDKVKCTFPAINRTAYEIILAAYTIQHNADNVIYSIVANDNQIEVVEQGQVLNVELDSQKDLRGTVYTKNIEAMINQVVVFKTENDKTQILDKAANELDKSRYGLFQKCIEYSKDMNNIFNAREMLKTLEETATIVCNGDVDILSGRSIGIKENKTGLVGSFLVANDTHVFKNGDYYCDLELSFNNVMDQVSFENSVTEKRRKGENNEHEQVS